MKKLAFACLAATFLTANVTADEGHDQEHPSLKYRHHAMETIKDSVGFIMGMLKQEREYNAAEWALHTKAIAGNAAASKAAFDMKMPGGETLDAAWENWEDFSAKTDKLLIDADELAAATEMPAQAAAFKKLLSNCKACHDDYRKEH